MGFTVLQRNKIEDKGMERDCYCVLTCPENKPTAPRMKSELKIQEPTITARYMSEFPVAKPEGRNREIDFLKTCSIQYLSLTQTAGFLKMWLGLLNKSKTKYSLVRIA